MPDTVERTLQFGEYRGSADQQRDEADDRGQHALPRIAGGLQQFFHRFRTLVAHQAAQLGDDLAASSVCAKDEAGYGDDNQQHGRQRKHGVIRQRRTHAGRKVVYPCGDGCLDHIPAAGQKGTLGYGLERRLRFGCRRCAGGACRRSG